MRERCCRTCRYWDRLSINAREGDCRAPGDHRYSRVPMPDGSYALLDSFGPETTSPNHVCGVWDDGRASPPWSSPAARARALKDPAP